MNTLKPGPNWTKRKSTERSLFLRAQHSKQVREEPVVNWAVAGTRDGSFAIRFKARHLKSKQLGDRWYYFTRSLLKPHPLTYGHLEVTYFLKDFADSWMCPTEGP